MPGRQGYETNAAIMRAFGTGGNSAPIVTVIELPAGVSATTPAVQSQLRDVDARIQRGVEDRHDVVAGQREDALAAEAAKRTSDDVGAA